MRPTNRRLDGERTKALYDLGLAIHWLYPKSKEPIGKKWSQGDRKSWPDLRESYKRGMNVGVRLGSPSKIGEQFLAVIDCDVKSSLPNHQVEMLEKFESLIPPSVFAHAPIVNSGRGNGSRHVYVLTDQPVRAQRLAQSSEKVKVLMPSAKSPSRFELETLSEEDLKKGYRLRPAWEISLMGEGQQVVLPPSIHPDTGAEYEWGREISSKIPLFKIDQKKRDELETVHQDFEALEVDLVGSRLSSKVVDQIISGDGVEDRSAALLGVSNAMIKAGFSDNEILSVLTEPEYYLGEVGYAHAQTESRARAARWVRKYTLEKSKKETSAAEIFNDEVEIEDAEPLSKEEADAQEAALAPELEWFDQIERGSPESGGRPKNTLKNVILILQGEGGSDIFKRDEFANAELYGRLAPWGSLPGAEFTDLDTIRIKDWLSKKWRFEPSNDRINEAVSRIADLNRFHPVRDYLDGLTWDGVPRLDTWLKRLLGAIAPEPYLSAVSRKVLVAMVKRVYEPGAKYDQVLILEGSQGRGKSRTLRALAGDAWFTDATINVGDKDAILTMRSIWLVEMGELSTMRRADAELLKEFISRTTDRIRVPYGKRTENFPRQCIFIGTTNQKEYLKDTTGNRRYWPVEVGACDVEAVSAERDQLFAEAKFAYELGEPLWLEDEAMSEGATREQEARAVHDAWEDLIADWIAKGSSEDDEGEMSPRVDRSRFRTEDLFDEGGGPLGNWKLDPPNLKRVGDILRKMGFFSDTLWDQNTKRTRRYWVVKSDQT